MNKRILTIALMVLIVLPGIAQVGIGTTTPDASAALDITASDKGLLIPRVTTAQKDAIVNPAEGLQVYDTDTKTIWIYDGTAWKESSGGSGKFVDGASPDIAYYSGRVGIGRNGFSTIHKLYVENNLNGGQNAVAKFDAFFNGTGNSKPVYGSGSFARNTGSGTIDYAIGSQGVVINGASSTISNAVGSWPQFFNKGGSVTWGASMALSFENEAGSNTAQGYGINTEVHNYPGASMGQGSLASFYFNNEGSITGNAYGIWIGGAGAGNVAGNAYALYLSTPFASVSGNSYALYSDNTNDSYIGGNLGIGINAPQQKVHINGVMRLEPQAVAPSGGKGDLYAGEDGKLYFHDGIGWREVQLN